MCNLDETASRKGQLIKDRDVTHHTLDSEHSVLHDAQSRSQIEVRYCIRTDRICEVRR